MLQRWLKIVLAVIGVLAAADALHAIEATTDVALLFDDSAVSQRLASLEAEVQRLREPSPATLASHNTLSDLNASPDPTCAFTPSCGPKIGKDFFNCECRTGGVVAGAEAVFIKPFYTGAGAPNVDPAASNPFTGFVNYPQMQYNYTAAPRIWLGYVGENGLGGRGRFFDYHVNAANDVSVAFGAPPSTFTQTGLLALRTFDLELTQQIDFRYWNLQGFGGIRYAQVNQQTNVDVAGLPITNSSLSYYGTGPTAGLQGERAITSNGRWSMFFSGRGSLLYGHQRDNTVDVTGLYTNGNREISSAFASIWEMNLGPQWKMRLPRGGELFLRSSVEGQYWQGVGNFAPIGSLSPIGGQNHNNYAGGFGLLGFSTAIGITR